MPVTTYKMAKSLSKAYMNGYHGLVRETIRNAWSDNVSTDWRRATYNLLPIDKREEFLKCVMG